MFCPYKLPYKIVKAYLSELAGLLVTGLKMYTSSKIRYMRYTRPTLNEVKRSNSLHTKWPPETQAKEKKKITSLFCSTVKQPGLKSAAQNWRDGWFSWVLTLYTLLAEIKDLKIQEQWAKYLNKV